ncbi:beta-glucoside-specific PTS transporter subunit IIABC [Pseudolactococcus piscium]|nr:beta-glucoside-specific PTS transporter subunit IIABC [Lactococcus piscium]
MDYSKIASKILAGVGTQDNVGSLTHCMTRLRFVLKDDSKADDDLIADLEGVVAVKRQGGQYQVIIGNEVAKVYDEINKVGAFSDAGNSNVKKEKQNIFSTIIEFIAGCMSPLFPALIGSGLVKVVLLILGPSIFKLITDTSDTYIILNALSDATFYFLPILVAATAAQRLKTNMYMAMTIAAFLVYPGLITLLGGDKATHLFNVFPVVHASYASSLLPAMLSTLLLKHVDISVDKVTPEWAKNFFKPLATLFITGLLALVILAPAGAILGDWLMVAVDTLHTYVPWLTIPLLAAFMPFIVMTGMHWAFLPTTIMALSNPNIGFDMLLLPAMFASNIAQAGAVFGVALKSKSTEVRGMAIPAGISALLAGVTEPALYGVSLKNKKVLYAQMLAGGAAGLIAGIFSLKSFAMATPSLLSILQFIAPKDGNNFIIACIVFVVSFVGSLVGAYFLIKPNTVAASTSDHDVISEAELTVRNPIEGNVIALSDVEDATFASGVLGKGYAVEPSEGVVKAPFSGTVELMMNSYHAVGLKSDSGIELLIHVGIDTVELAGKYFTPKVKQGDQIKLGDTLLTFDIKAIKAAGYPIVTPIIVTNTDDFSEVKIGELGDKLLLETMIEFKK